MSTPASAALLISDDKSQILLFECERRNDYFCTRSGTAEAVLEELGLEVKVSFVPTPHSEPVSLYYRKNLHLCEASD